jgi:hypothetical protein
MRWHEHPCGKKNLLRNGPELKEALVGTQRIPPASAGCPWPALIGGLRHFRVLGSGGSLV